MEQFPIPKATCDGGDLDCGSGLLLIIKRSMDPVYPGEILEVRSRERSVAEDLPAWCRMVKHEFLGANKNDNDTSYFIRKGGATDSKEDLESARGYQWSVRIQSEKGTKAKVYSRNHSFIVGQPADFSAMVEAPSAIDYLLSALGSCITVGFHMHSSRQKITVDAMELSMKGKLDNVLYHMQLEDEGSPRVSNISGTLYVSSPEDESKLREVWQLTLSRSPIYQTLRDQVKIDLKMSIVF